MIEIIKLRNNRDTYIKSLKKRGLEEIEKKLEKLINLDDERKSLKTELDKLLTDSNKIAKEIGQIIKSGDHSKVSDLKTKSTHLKEETKKISEELKNKEIDIKKILVNIPNTPDERVPEGSSENDNIEILKNEININSSKNLKPH